MTQEKKKYLTKTVSFGGSKMTLYSVDGNTWSSRLDELDLLQERFENGGRLPVDATKGKQPFVIRKNKFAKRAAEDEPPSLDDYDDAAVAIEDESLAGVVLDEEIEEEALVDEVPTIKALSKAAKRGGGGGIPKHGLVQEKKLSKAKATEGASVKTPISSAKKTSQVEETIKPVTTAKLSTGGKLGLKGTASKSPVGKDSGRIVSKTPATKDTPLGASKGNLKLGDGRSEKTGKAASKVKSHTTKGSEKSKSTSRGASKTSTKPQKKGASSKKR